MLKLRKILAIACKNRRIRELAVDSLGEAALCVPKPAGTF